MKNLFILLFLFGNLSLSAQTAAHSDSISKAIVRLLAQQLAFPQEKIYLQTDRPYYIAGEKVFFRTFLINAAFLTPAMYSRYVYVELLSPADTVVVRQQIRMDENKMFYGALTLPEALPEGEYRIRSYTRYMENWGEFWFYTRPLFIANPASAKAEKQPPKSRSKNVPEINFYPEGGNLIAGQTNRVAFKALLPGGKPIAVTGSVFDSNDELQATFTTLHEGMGTFNLKVRAGEKYHARYEHNNRQYKLKLPIFAKTNCPQNPKRIVH
ncbi:MAG: hypothetical protein LBP72_05440 [Dysgonamonadaceae bacterium]|jgi:uncharacterized protein YfaS (alpha-2-macroglobulin family)|nr:hypothetical protein [Dysgonamonadaceae bacterium]